MPKYKILASREVFYELEIEADSKEIATGFGRVSSVRPRPNSLLSVNNISFDVDLNPSTGSMS